MTPPPVDPRWPKILSLSVHEFRTPLTVVAGYIRMVLKERAGPLPEPQRRLLEEAEKSCGRLSALLAEVSELSGLEAGTVTVNRQSADLRGVLRESVRQLPPLREREIQVELQAADSAAPIHVDTARMTTALTSVLAALRRELVTSDRLFVTEQHDDQEPRVLYDIRIGDKDALTAIDAEAENLPVFDEWRGGCGLSLPVARRVIEAHGGSIWSAPGEHKTGVRVVLPAREN